MDRCCVVLCSCSCFWLMNPTVEFGTLLVDTRTMDACGSDMDAFCQ